MVLHWQDKPKVHQVSINSTSESDTPANERSEDCSYSIRRKEFYKCLQKVKSHKDLTIQKPKAIHLKEKSAAPIAWMRNKS